MADSVTELLRRLDETKGDTRAQAVVAAEFALAMLPEEDQAPVRAALDAAAVLRWFDSRLLARLLEIPEEESRRLSEQLKTFPFIERYRSGAEDLRNVHESTRLGWRKRLALEAPERFRALSSAAAGCFAGDLSPSARIEWIYHLLSGDPDRGTAALQRMGSDWSGRLEDHYALAAALRELDETGLVRGRSCVWVLLTIAWTRVSKGEQSQLAAAAFHVLSLARRTGDLRAEGNAHVLLGDVMSAQANIKAALSAYEEYLSISERLAADDPGNDSKQREIAVARNRVGSVWETQGRYAEAQAAYEASLAINKRLTDQDPDNTRWQRDLAVTYSRLGTVFAAQNHLAEAREANETCLAITSRMAERHPNNDELQRELAVAHGRRGDELVAEGDLAEALIAHEKYRMISRRLAEQDPANAVWVWDLVVAHRAVGNVLELQGKSSEATAAFREYLDDSRRLAELDPLNAGCQREVALACARLGRQESKAGRYEPALALFEEASRIFASVVARRWGIVLWEQEKETIDWQLARCRELALAAAERSPSAESASSSDI
jgi:tetratricopeptide (TPR) repeat protein